MFNDTVTSPALVDTDISATDIDGFLVRGSHQVNEGARSRAVVHLTPGTSYVPQSRAELGDRRTLAVSLSL